MILNKNGETFDYEGKSFTVGQTVYANAESVYSGLTGTILEIRDSEDKETDNDTPDIYCAFEESDIVIMAPGMLEISHY